MSIKVILLFAFSVLFVGLNLNAWPWSWTLDDYIRAHDIAGAKEAINNGAVLDFNKTRKIVTGRQICMPYYVKVDYLMEAAYEGDIVFVDLYLKHKADPNKANDLGMTALYFASSFPSWDSNDRIVPHMRHDQIHTRKNLRDSGRFRRYGDLFAKYSAYLEDARLPNKLQVVKLLIKLGAHVDAKDNRGMTPLMAAISGSMKDIAEELIKSGADVNAKDNEGKTPIMFAVYNNQNAELVEYLLQKGADISVPVNKGKFAGLYPLDLAKLSDHPNRDKYISLLEKAAHKLQHMPESPELRQALEDKTRGKARYSDTRYKADQLPYWLNQEEER